MYFKHIEIDEDNFRFELYDLNDNFVGFLKYEKIHDINILFNSNYNEDIIESLDEYFPYGSCYYIEFLEIKTKFQGLGYGNYLIEEFLLMVENTDWSQTVFLDASPYVVEDMLSKLPLSYLVKFYEKHGFSVFLDKGLNKLMIRN